MGIVTMRIKNVDESKIEKAIDDFEQNVDCELIPVIAKHSSYMEHISWVISLILLLVFIGLIDVSLQDSWASKTIYYLIAPIAAVILGNLIDKSDLVDRFFISKRERTRQCIEKAQRIYFLKRSEHHKSRQAIMLFVSIMERQIVIYPDPGMKIEGLESLQTRLIEIIKDDFKKGQFEAGFLDAIRYLKAELSARYPQTQASAQKASQNHYSNKLIWWDV